MPKHEDKLGSEEEVQGDGNGEADAPEGGAEPQPGQKSPKLKRAFRRPARRAGEHEDGQAAAGEG